MTRFTSDDYPDEEPELEREEQSEYNKKSKSRPRSKSKDKDKSDENRKRKYLRKYTYNGVEPLFESVIIQQLPRFVSYTRTNDDYKIQPLKYLESTGYDVYPADTIDTQNPLPYIFGLHELEEYVNIAKNETFETLFSKVESIFRKYVNAEDHYIVLMAASTIYSYFQDKFGTTHYIIFVGDNGSGKGSALLTYKYLGYRVFYVVSASAPNYFTFLGDIEECQGTIAEDEAEDIAFNLDKNKLLKGGYASGATIPKVELSPGKRTQEVWNTFCHKWFAMEEEPDYKKIKGIRDRSFVINMIVGKVPYNIKDIIGRKSGDSKHMELYDELIHVRKLLLAFRLLHYEDKISDIKLNVIHRNEELTKPLLRLFSYRNDAPKALERIRLSLSKFILGRNEVKKNSIESKLLEAIKDLIGLTKEEQKTTTEDIEEETDDYSFLSEDIWLLVRPVMDGTDSFNKDGTVMKGCFYSSEYGTISQKRVTSLYKSKLKADSYKDSDTGKRGLKFSKEVLDRLEMYYNVPNEILIVPADPADPAHCSSVGEGENNENERKSHAQEHENKGENSVHTTPEPAGCAGCAGGEIPNNVTVQNNMYSDQKPPPRPPMEDPTE